MSDLPWECYLCDMKFLKRAMLRAHENEMHHQPQRQDSSLNQPTMPNKRIKYDTSDIDENVTGILIPKIQSPIIDSVLKSNQIPFAVLHFLENVPMLVRIVNLSPDKDLLRAVTQGDFDAMKKHSNAMSLPIVASIYQCLDLNGQIAFNIAPPQSIYDNMSDERQIKLHFLDTNANTTLMIQELERIQLMQKAHQEQQELQQSQIKIEDNVVAENSAKIEVQDEQETSLSSQIICRPIEWSELQSQYVNDENLRAAFEDITSGRLLSPKKSKILTNEKNYSETNYVNVPNIIDLDAEIQLEHLHYVAIPSYNDDIAEIVITEEDFNENSPHQQISNNLNQSSELETTAANVVHTFDNFVNAIEILGETPDHMKIVEFFTANDIEMVKYL